MTYKRFRPWMLNGHPGNLSRACKRYIVRAVNAGLVVTSTTDGTHATHSYHYPLTRGALGRAVDVAGPMDRMLRFQRAEYGRNRRRYRELLGPSNRACVSGGTIFRMAEGAPLETLHDTHVHGAPRW